jgi:hypothetical protein
MREFFKETNRQLGIEIRNAFRFAGYLLVLGVATFAIGYFISVILALVVGCVGFFYLQRVSYTVWVAEVYNRRILDIE